MKKAKIIIHLKVIKKLNIGSKKPSLKADIPFEKITIGGEERLYIPASAIKGILRASAIKIAHLLGHTNVEYTVEPSKLRQSSDIITSIFGKPDHEGKIMISTIPLSSNNTALLYHVRIDDKYGIVKEGSLFRIEYLNIGENFSCEINCHDLSIEEMRLLLAAISQLRYERFGRAGMVEISVDKHSEVSTEYLKDEIINTIWSELVK